MNLPRRTIPALMTLLTLCAAAFSASAQSWDAIRTSGDYYYGIGMGKTVEDATLSAQAAMASMIATNVSHEFDQIDDIRNKNGSAEHSSRVLSCVKTYSQATFTNMEKFPPQGKAPEITMRVYIRKSELEKIYRDRINKAKDMAAMADEALARNKVDMALQYYYWSYSLLRSLQRPSEVTGADGKILVNSIPQKIREILSDIKITYDKREEDNVDLLFTYRGEPASRVEFTYSDGRAECDGYATDGHGMIQMAPGYETDYYHINVEYQFTRQAHGDPELSSVLDVITPQVFQQSEFHVKASEAPKPRKIKKNERVDVSAQQQVQDSRATSNVNAASSPEAAKVGDYAAINELMGKVIDAIRQKRYTDNLALFTFEGREVFDRLIHYGTARIINEPVLKFYPSWGGRTTVRGLNMSFSFNSGKRKKTFVEDVVFTFNADNRIENIAFGLGAQASSDILDKNAPGWKADAKEVIVEFLENYKTAYSLERLDYISSIFAEDAIIITGTVVKRGVSSVGGVENKLSTNGRDIITYNRFSKATFLDHLKSSFNRNEFINLKFGNNEVQYLQKFTDQDLYAINISQEYTSSTYSDQGYLFLIVDMTNRSEPMIKVRTWQPNEVPVGEIYHAGDFF